MGVVKKCVRGNRCTRCLKLMFKLQAKRYQEQRRFLFEGEKDRLSNIRVSPFAIQSLLDQRVKVGRAYRRWKRKAGRKSYRGISRLTALTIQSWPDAASVKGTGIYITGAKVGDKWAGHVYLVKGNEVHRQLLSTDPVFKSKGKATADTRRIVEAIRDMDLSEA